MMQQLQLQLHPESPRRRRRNSVDKFSTESGSATGSGVAAAAAASSSATSVLPRRSTGTTVGAAGGQPASLLRRESFLGLFMASEGQEGGRHGGRRRRRGMANKEFLHMLQSEDDDELLQGGLGQEGDIGGDQAERQKELFSRVTEWLREEEQLRLRNIFSLVFSDPILENLFSVEQWEIQRVNLLLTMTFVFPVIVAIFFLQLFYHGTGFYSASFALLTVAVSLIALSITFAEQISRWGQQAETQINEEVEESNGEINHDRSEVSSDSTVDSTAQSIETGQHQIVTNPIFRSACIALAHMYPVLTSIHFLYLEFVSCPQSCNFDVVDMNLPRECRWLQQGLSPPFWHYAPCLTLAISVLSGVRWKSSAPLRAVLLVSMLFVFVRRLRSSVLIPTISIHIVLAVLLLFVMFTLERATRRNFLEEKLQLVALREQRCKARLEMQKADEEAKAKKLSASEKVQSSLRVSFPDYDAVSSKTKDLIDKALKALPESEYKEIKQCEFDFDDFELERRLSSGGFCTVYRGTHKGKPCAVKSISAHDALNYDAIEGLIQEVLTLTRLKHPNIIETVGHCWTPHICLILEFMEKGTLHDLLSYRSLEISWHDPLLTLAAQMADALDYLHSHNPPLLHRDIKTRNVLMADLRHCKLADFGLSIALQDDKAKRAAGTRRYCAPELLQGSPSSIAADVWSFGVCLWEMATRVHFPDREPKITTLPDDLPYPIPKTVRDVEKACLMTNPSTRPGFTEIKVILHQALKEESSKFPFLREGSTTTYNFPTNTSVEDSVTVGKTEFSSNSSATKQSSGSGSKTHARRSSRSSKESDSFDAGGSMIKLKTPQGSLHHMHDEASFDATVSTFGEERTDRTSSIEARDEPTCVRRLDSESDVEDVAERFAKEMPAFAHRLQDFEVSALSGMQSAEAERLWGDAAPKLRANNFRFQNSPQSESTNIGSVSLWPPEGNKLEASPEVKIAELTKPQKTNGTNISPSTPAANTMTGPVATPIATNRAGFQMLNPAFFQNLHQQQGNMMQIPAFAQQQPFFQPPQNVNFQNQFQGLNNMQPQVSPLASSIDQTPGNAHLNSIKPITTVHETSKPSQEQVASLLSRLSEANMETAATFDKKRQSQMLFEPDESPSDIGSIPSVATPSVPATTPPSFTPMEMYFFQMQQMQQMQQQQMLAQYYMAMAMQGGSPAFPPMGMSPAMMSPGMPGMPPGMMPGLFPGMTPGFPGAQYFQQPGPGLSVQQGFPSSIQQGPSPQQPPSIPSQLPPSAFTPTLPAFTPPQQQQQQQAAALPSQQQQLPTLTPPPQQQQAITKSIEVASEIKREAAAALASSQMETPNKSLNKSGSVATMETISGTLQRLQMAESDFQAESLLANARKKFNTGVAAKIEASPSLAKRTLVGQAKKSSSFIAPLQPVKED